jgi:hypothetical protein
MTSQFEDTYPRSASWVEDHGRIEIGQDDYLDNGTLAESFFSA